MKLKLLGAAIAAGMTCATWPAQAADIVQEARDEEPIPFNFFNPALGTLDAVTVRFIVRQFPVGLNYFANSAGPFTLSYDLSVPFPAFYSVTNGSSSGSGSFRFNVDLKGSQEVTLQPNFGTFPFFGTTTILANGFGEFSLDPSLFVSSNPPNPDARNFFDISKGTSSPDSNPVPGTVSLSAPNSHAFAFKTG